ncbi:hypothetical protein LA983_001017 [Vibrio fluvialis]|nr:hypothetical protein [Vibrio fluvialis]
MLTVEGLPNSFKWEDDGRKWVTNYLKTKASTFSTNEKISDLLQQYYNSQIGLEDTREQFECLIADILNTGDAGKLFVGKLSATWRARHARQGKKHYNLSLDSSTYAKLTKLSNRTKVANSSIKQTLTTLIEDAYSALENERKDKAKRSRPFTDHQSEITAKNTDKKLTKLEEKIESVINELEQQKQTISTTPQTIVNSSSAIDSEGTLTETGLQLAELKEQLKSLTSENEGLKGQVGKYAEENAKLHDSLKKISSASESHQVNDNELTNQNESISSVDRNTLSTEPQPKPAQDNNGTESTLVRQQKSLKIKTVN